MRTLVCIITGGRPELKDRVTRGLFPDLREAGLTDIEWVIRSDHVEGYEEDDNPLNVYPVEWANEYARAHWRHPRFPWEPGGFFGAFCGREWAMRTATERGYGAVLQLDDNVLQLGVVDCNRPASRRAASRSELFRLMLELSASSNAMMLGAQLNSVNPSSTSDSVILRPGYPYSVFVEKTQGRLPYFGPFEDDIMHALEYARRGGPNRTAAVAPLIRYLKEHGSKSGMRSHYDSQRGIGAAKEFPENVRIGVGRRTSSLSDSERGPRHFLNTKGFTPVRVIDHDRFAQAEVALRQMAETYTQAFRNASREKMKQRAGRSDGATVDAQTGRQGELASGGGGCDAPS